MAGWHWPKPPAHEAALADGIRATSNLAPRPAAGGLGSHKEFTMDKHTSGPWNRGFGNFVYQGKRPEPGARQRLIAVCEPTTKTLEDWDETFANARLIAAAPDLLAALIAVMEMPVYNGTKETSVARLNIKRAARAAIAKATGSQEAA